MINHAVSNYLSTRACSINIVKCEFSYIATSFTIQCGLELFVGAASCLGGNPIPHKEKVRKAIKRVVHGSFDTEFLGDDAENRWDGKRYSNIWRCYWCYLVQEILWEFAFFHVLFPASNASNSRVPFAGRCLGFVPQQTSHTLVKDQARQMHRIRNPYWHGWKYCIWMVGWVLFDYSSTR